MNYALDRFAAEVRQCIAETGLIHDNEIELQVPKANVPADLCFPAFRAAKQRKQPPPAIASSLVECTQPPANSLIGEITQAGPYVNISLHQERFAKAVIEEIATAGERYGHDITVGKGERVVVDYSSPNVAKRMHVGHIRSTIIGQAVVNICRALGYGVISDNHLGDWGKQFGVIIAAIKRYGKPDAHGNEALKALEEIYARYNREMEEAPKGDTTLDDEARQWSLRLEQGDEEARALWQWCVSTTNEANQFNYDRLGVQFDHIYGESFYEGMLADEIQRALDAGVARRDDDSSVIVENLDKLPTFLLQRSDGGTLYLTRDIATISFRMREFAPRAIIYVVGAPQDLHFRQLFALARNVGIVSDDVDLIHVSFGTIFDNTKKALSTRYGNMIYLKTLLDDAVDRAKGVIEEKNPDLPPEERDAVAEAVGIGAIIYNDLYQDPKRNITLDWESMLATEGNSATYLQYSHARCRSILRRAETTLETVLANGVQEDVGSLLTHPSEQQLLKHLARLPLVVRDAGRRYAPSLIAEWCYTTAREFGVFFEQCSVLKADTPMLREARLALVAATAQSLKNGLSLLGIKAPNRM